MKIGYHLSNLKKDCIHVEYYYKMKGFVDVMASIEKPLSTMRILGTCLLTWAQCSRRSRCRTHQFRQIHAFFLTVELHPKQHATSGEIYSSANSAACNRDVNPWCRARWTRRLWSRLGTRPWRQQEQPQSARSAPTLGTMHCGAANTSTMHGFQPEVLRDHSNNPQTSGHTPLIPIT